MLPLSEILIRLALASLFGGLVGLERERKNWSAGLRTHMMVSVGSCLIMIVSMYGFFDVLGENITLDPSRVAAQVVSGIGFIGAGTILFLNKRIVRGLTTATGLWTVAAIGMATGGGLYFAAGITTLIAIVILWGLQLLEQKYFTKSQHTHLKVKTYKEVEDSEFLQNIFSQNDPIIQSFSVKKQDDGQVYDIIFENIEPKKVDGIVNILKNDDKVKEISWY